MKARDLVAPQPTVRASDPALDAMRLLGRPDIRAVLVVQDDGRLAGVLWDSRLLRELLPPYVEEDAALAGVLGERAAEVLASAMIGKRVADLLPDDLDEEPVVDGGATLIEVASVMVRAGVPMVGVLEDGTIAGGITIETLLSRLLAERA